MMATGMFSFIGIIVLLGFCLVFGVIIIAIVKGLSRFYKNEYSETIKTEAVIISRRTEIKGNATYTKYFLTFQIDSGSRFEFMVSGNEYGTLMDNDKGVLTFQGTRYKGFERIS